jgi:serine/threonine-protein kinase RsbW
MTAVVRHEHGIPSPHGRDDAAVNDAGAVLRIPADVRQLADVRGFIRSVAGRAGAGQQEMDDLVTAVDESVTNVIVHGYRGGTGTVEIEVAVADQRLVVRVRDEAPPFDPTRMPDVDTSLPPEQRSPGGLGIHLARDLADQVRYERTPRGNELTLIKEYGAKGGPTC